MTKRYGNHPVNNGKRPKLDEDELWDDDLDPAAIDKCFELAATQPFSQKPVLSLSRDVSIAPTYSAFKNPAAFASSTQATTSTGKRISLTELECEIRRLKQQNEEKEGEISVLRSKIKETSTSVQVEQQKTTNEWREKLHVAQKQVNSVKSDLEFKNLEIANLKQQLSELRKINLESMLHTTQQQVVPAQPLVKVNQDRAPKPKSQNEAACKEAILEPIYPLKSISPQSFADPSGESHMIKNTCYKISRNTIPYLQNQQTYNEENFHHKCARLGGKKITLENVYPEIFQLANSTLEEINSSECIEAVNKIICVTLILLKDLNDYLVEFGSHLRTEDIQQSDANYLLNDEQPESSATYQNLKLGIQASKILDVISRLVSCNELTVDFICRDKLLKLPPSCREYAKLIPHRNGAVQTDFYLTRLLLTIVGNIGKYRLARQTNSFLLSTVSLLETIAILDNTDYMETLCTSTELFCKLFKEIVFARPRHEIIEKIISLLKVSARYKSFVKYLFKKNGNSELLKAGPKGVLYYNEDVCCFCVLAILLQNYASRVENISLEVCYNMLSFIYNTFKTSHWMHHESEDNVCACLSQLYKLEIDFVFRGMADFIKCHKNIDKKKNGISDEWSRFLHHEITQKVLNQMNFNNYELTEKYVMVFSQFKEIEKTLNRDGLFNAAQLNISEELVKVSPESFMNVF